jgi:hypothetical protein
MNGCFRIANSRGRRTDDGRQLPDAVDSGIEPSQTVTNVGFGEDNCGFIARRFHRSSNA